MAIAKETLNSLLLATDVHTGVYMDHQRHTCVVVKVSKEGKVLLLHFRNCTVDIEVSFKEKFLRDYPLELYHYPAMRALRKFARYVRDGFACTPEARKVINSVLAQ